MSCRAPGASACVRSCKGVPIMVAEVRFLPLTDVAEILNVTVTQARALVRSGELRAIKVGGRGQWRIEKAELEDYIQRMYSQTQQEIREGRVDV